VPLGEEHRGHAAADALACGVEAGERLRVVAAVDEDRLGGPQSPAECRDAAELLLRHPTDLEVPERDHDGQHVERAPVVRHEDVRAAGVEVLEAVDLDLNSA